MLRLLDIYDVFASQANCGFRWCVAAHLDLTLFFFQYLKDKKKGKYSMISGKKIKMKVKKSKKDKQVIRFFLCRVIKKSCFFFIVCAVNCSITCTLFHHSGIKIEQNFLSSWTLPCDASWATACPQNSGLRTQLSFQEETNEEFSEREITKMEWLTSPQMGSAKPHGVKETLSLPGNWDAFSPQATISPCCCAGD